MRILEDDDRALREVLEREVPVAPPFARVMTAARTRVQRRQRARRRLLPLALAIAPALGMVTWALSPRPRGALEEPLGSLLEVECPLEGLRTLRIAPPAPLESLDDEIAPPRLIDATSVTSRRSP